MKKNSDIIPQRNKLACEDILMIQGVIVELALHLDLCQFDDARKLFADDAVTDFSSAFGEKYKNEPIEKFFTRTSAFLPGFDATSHVLTNFLVTGQGDDAECRSYVRVTHSLDKQCWSVVAMYLHKLVRTDDGWKISFWSPRLLYQEGQSFSHRPLDDARKREPRRQTS